MLIVGCQIITIHKYNVFQDPFAVLLFIIMMVVGRLGRFAFKVLSNLLKVWKKQK